MQGKQLIIAEKPSLMRTIIEALGTIGERFSEKEGGEYFESQNYIATAQFGHLLELKMPEEYPGRENLGSWSIDNLPFFPKKYEYNARKDSMKRYNTIKKLVHSSAVSGICHCGDPDREGQILVDLVLKNIGNTKPVVRPYLKALTNEAIVDAFRTAQPNSAYINVYNEGMTRMCFDWDYGINLSQYATIKTNARPALNIGRVIGAIVTEIYNRDTAIEKFVPEEYFKVISDVEGGFKLVSKERFPGDKRADAELWASRLQLGHSVVTDVQEKKVTKAPPKLFSQTSLQGAMSKRFGYKPDKTLSLAQSLYEKGYISYPRTDTEYIAEAEKDEVRKVIDRINRDGYLAFRDSKSIFDDSKIDGHSAITPTGKRPEGLSDDEKNCYLAVLYRFMAVFCKDPCIYNKTIVLIENPLEEFKVSGEVMVQEGWQKFEPKKKAEAKKKADADDGDEEDDNRVLPKVSVGDRVITDFRAVSAMTTPPKHYTAESLLNWMKNPFKKEDSTDEDDYKNILSGLQIGTSATRAPILEKAENKGYISLKKKAYRIEPRGRFLVESCNSLGIDFSAQMTAEMGRQLKAVGKGEAGIMDVLNANRSEVSRVIRENRESSLLDSAAFGGAGEYIKKEKTEANVFAPTGESVSFNKEWGGHAFTEEEVSLLLAGEEISFEAVSAKGNAYTATGRLAKQKYKGKELWGFVLNEREFPESWGGHMFTEEERDILLSGEVIHATDLYSQAKMKIYEADLKWDKKKRSIVPVFEKKKRK